MKVIFGTLPFNDLLIKSLRVFKRDPSRVGLATFGSSPIPIDEKQNLFNLFYVFGAPRGINEHGDPVLSAKPSPTSTETSKLLNYIFGVDVNEIAQYLPQNSELVEDLKREFPQIPDHAEQSLIFALNLANYVSNSDAEQAVQIIRRWNAVANAIDNHENLDELPDPIRKIVAQLPVHSPSV